jgi:hypothetical protein
MHTKIRLMSSTWRQRRPQKENPAGKMPTPSLVFDASKVLTGNTDSPKLLIVAALVWMFMDVSIRRSASA